jgi:phosphoenolpyruvate-protein kinase (PTS system EI component)
MKKLTGIPASNGIAISPVFIYQPAKPKIEHYAITDPTAEIVRLETAIATAYSQLATLKAKTEAMVGPEEAQIFEVHQMFLADEAFLDPIKETVETEKINVEAALAKTVTHLSAQFKALDDEYFRQRAADIEDVGQRLQRLLAGWGESSLADVSKPIVLPKI